MDSTTGVLSGTPTTPGGSTFTVTATNGVSPDATADLTVTVTPAPTFTVTSGALPAGLTLTEAGVLSGTPTATGVSTFTVTAANGVGTDAVTPNITVTVTPALAAPVFTADTPPASAVVGTPYTYTFTATGYPAPTFAVTGTLPAGLNLDSTTGVLAGTPTSPGSVTFTLTATNSAGEDSKAYTVVMTAAAVAPTITTGTLPAATVGAPYSETVTATGTGPITFTVSSGDLPGGLVLDSSTGVVSGTPTSAGSVTFTLTATNSAGADSKAYAIVTTAVAITKTAAAAPVLPSTGFDVLPWGVGGVLTLLIGVVLLVLVAKYRRSHAA